MGKDKETRKEEKGKNFGESGSKKMSLGENPRWGLGIGFGLGKDEETRKGEKRKVGIGGLERGKIILGEGIPDPKRQRLVEKDGCGKGLGASTICEEDEIKKQEDEQRFDRNFEELFGDDPIFKAKVKARSALAKTFVKQTSDSEDADYEEEDCGGGEEEEDWKKGKPKEEQCQMLIDSFQNNHLFKSDTDDLSEGEFGEHDMTYQEFVKDLKLVLTQGCSLVV